jgi:hypothetical protein
LAAAAARKLLDLGLVSECHHWCRQALDVMGVGEAGTLVELDLQRGSGCVRDVHQRKRQ